jgi:Molybdopterin biosynthesis enzymes
MNVNIALLTVTDTRTLKTDKSGNILADKISKANHNLVDRKILKIAKNQ